MRLIPILTALVVITGLYLLLFERQSVLDFAHSSAAQIFQTGGGESADTGVGAETREGSTAGGTADAGAGTGSAADAQAEKTGVSVIALRSIAREIDSAVLLHGRTEASRQVAVKAETSGQVITVPRAKGSWVEAGDILCQLDPGTREVALEEARARLAEARARIPEAEARVAEAQSRVPAARAGLAEARSRVPTAEAALANAKSQITAAAAAMAQAQSQVPAAEAALAQARSRVPAAQASLKQAESQVEAAEAALTNAIAQKPVAEARLAEAEARLADAERNYNAAVKLQEGGYASEARVTNALAALESARAGVQTAISQLEAARSGVQSAKSQVEGAKAGVQSALSQIETARAGVQSAMSQIEAAKAGVQSARSQMEGAKAGVQSAMSQVEAAQAGIETAKSQIEAAAAGVQSAQSGVENAKAGVQSAEARVASVELDIENLTIRAPFAGLLESDAAELGSLLQPGAPCATLVLLDPIKLVGFVPEADVEKVRVGVAAGGRLGNGEDLMGTVSFLSRVSDPLTRTFRVEIDVPNPDQSISDGLTVEMLIPSEGRMAHLLPQSSLTLDDNGALGVRVVEKDGAGRDIARFAEVELIRDTIEGVWVAGLPDIASVIVVGQNYVTDGVVLDVTYREPDT